MSSVRLTKEMREDIVANVVKSTFAKRASAIEKENQEIAEMIYKEVVGDHILSVSCLPDGFMPTVKEIIVYVGPRWNEKKTFEMLDRKRFPNQFIKDYLKAYKPSEGNPDLSASLIKKISSHMLKIDKINEDKDNLRSSVRSIVQSVTTIKSLLEVWPEATKYIPERVTKEPKQLPALPIADLNEMIKKLS